MKKSFAIFATAVFIAATLSSCGEKESTTSAPASSGDVVVEDAVVSPAAGPDADSASSVDLEKASSQVDSTSVNEAAPVVQDDFDPSAPIKLSRSGLQVVDPIRTGGVDEEGKGWYGNPDITSSTYTFPTMYVVGWSYDSHLAYFTEDFEEGRGTNMIRLYIQDMVEDKIVWSAFHEDWTDENVYVDTEFIEKLREYKIHTEKKIAFETLPVMWNGNQVDFALESTREGENEFGMSVKSYKCTATRKGMKTKTVDSGKDMSAEDFYLCGYYMSPFEERVALVIGYTSYTFEGLGVFYKIVGCDLNKNF